MSQKTKRLYAAAPLDGATLNDAVNSFKQALINLENRGVHENREVLYDTLEARIEREQIDDITIMGADTVQTYTMIHVDAEGVLRG